MLSYFILFSLFIILYISHPVISFKIGAICEFVQLLIPFKIRFLAS